MTQALEFKTTENRQKHLAMHFPPRPPGSWLFFRLSCTDPLTNRWTFVIYECMANDKTLHLLKGVPDTAEKIWRIIRTVRDFTIHCNNALVLNFNYQSDHATGFSQCQDVWTRESTGVSFQWENEMYERGFISMRIRGRWCNKIMKNTILFR